MPNYNFDNISKGAKAVRELQLLVFLNEWLKIHKNTKEFKPEKMKRKDFVSFAEYVSNEDKLSLQRKNTGMPIYKNPPPPPLKKNNYDFIDSKQPTGSVKDHEWNSMFVKVFAFVGLVLFVFGVLFLIVKGWQ